MIASEFGGESIWVLDVAPDWEEGVACGVSVVAAVDAGLTNRENRRGFSRMLRLRTEFQLTARGEAARRVHAGLMGMGSEPVVMPFWPGAVRWSARVTMAVGGGLYVVFKEGFSQFEIYEAGAEPGWPAGEDMVAPALWGRLESREVEWLGPDVLVWQVRHVEASLAAWAIVPAAAVFEAGPAPSAAAVYVTAPRLFPFEVNFGPGVGEDFTLAILRQPIGFGRGVQETLYPQAVAREQGAEYFFGSAAEVGRLLRFFEEHAAGKGFWIADWVSGVVLAEPAAADDTVLEVWDTAGVSIGDWVGFASPDRGVFGTGRIVDKGEFTVELEDEVGVELGEGVLVCRLLLVRFEGAGIEVQWRCNDYAECRLRVRELAQEYNEAADEVLGVSQGQLGTRVFLYEFSRGLNGVLYYDRFTSFEGDLGYSSFTWGAGKITHGELRGGIYLERDEVEVTAGVVDGHPLVLQATLRLESPLRLRIYQGVTADGASVTGVTTVFSGEVVSASVKGGIIKARAVMGSGLFERKVPRFMFQRGCNHALFSVGCGLLAANWKFTGTMFNVGSAGYPFEFVVHSLARVSGPGPTFFANWFAGGWLELGAGLSWQRRGILLSSNVVAGAVTLTLERDPSPYPVVGDGVVIYPGCDLTMEACKGYDATRNAGGKFDNFVNFGGHPWMPIANPTLATSKARSGGGKK